MSDAHGDAAPVVSSAQAGARAMRHAETSDDHLLLALAMGDDLAADIIGRWVSVEELHRVVAQAHPTSDGDTDPPITRRLARVLDAADVRPTTLTGAPRPITAALLIAVLDQRGDAAGALRKLSVDVDEMERDVLLSVTAPPTSASGPDDGGDEEAASEAFEVRWPEPAAALPPPSSLRDWPSPRCHGCRNLVRDHARMWTMEVPDPASGEVVRFRFLYCGSCGTAFAIENLDR